MTENEFLDAIKISAAQQRFHPFMAEALRLQNEVARRAAQAPDTAQLARAGYDREMRGLDDQAAAMALSTAIPQFHGIAQQTHRAGLEAQQPTQMGEGVYMPGTGYVADPFKRQDRLTRAVAAQAAAARDFGSLYGQEAERELSREHQRQVFEEQKRHARVVEGHSGAQLALARQNAELGKIIQVENADGSKSAYRVTPNGLMPMQVLGQGPVAPSAYPAVANPRASDSERTTAYQTQAIAGRAATVDPNFAAPGFWETTARTFLPGVGNATANMLSSGPRQVARQSQEGIVDSLIWLTTGAGTTQQQVEQQRGEYIPNYFDKPEAVAIKRAKLVQLAAAARNRAGRAWTQAQELELRQAFPELVGGVAPPLAPPTAGGPQMKTIGGRQYFKGPDGNWYTP